MKKAYIYRGGFSIVKKSGVGKAMEHQQKMLQYAAVPIAKSWKEASVVHINTVFPDSFFAAKLAHLQGKKVIYYGHSTMEDFKNSFKGSNFFAPLFKKWFCLCYKQGDIIITPTPYSKTILQSYGIRKKIYALTNGIDTEFFCQKAEYAASFREKYHLTKEQKVVISIGHYIKRKGITDFLKIAKTMPEVTFIWFGATAEKLLTEEIKQAIAHVPDNVILAGFVPSEEIRDACCGADAFLFMSHEETEGIVVLEALACEVPVLLRDIPVYESWLEDKKQVRKAATLKQFRKLLSEILKQKPESMIKEGRKLAISHNMDNSGRKLKRIYRQEF